MDDRDDTAPAGWHDVDMTTEARQLAELELAAAAAEYKEAVAALRAAKERAATVTRAAKRAGISQYEIAHTMGEEWARDNNPQYPPSL